MRSFIWLQIRSLSCSTDLNNSLWLFISGVVDLITSQESPMFRLPLIILRILDQQQPNRKNINQFVVENAINIPTILHKTQNLGLSRSQSHSPCHVSYLHQLSSGHKYTNYQNETHDLEVVLENTIKTIFPLCKRLLQSFYDKSHLYQLSSRGKMASQRIMAIVVWNDHGRIQRIRIAPVMLNKPQQVLTFSYWCYCYGGSD